MPESTQTRRDTPRTLVTPLGGRIKTLREAKDWSQLTLAGKVGCSDATISRIEKSLSTDFKILLSIANVLDVQIDSIIDGGDAREARAETHVDPGETPVMVQMVFRSLEEWKVFELKLKQLVPDYNLISVWKGSIRVRVEMSPEDALRLLAAIEAGEFSGAEIESVMLESSKLSRQVRELASGSSDVRSAAARALGQMGPEAVGAMPALLKALGDPEADVRWAAAGALGRIGPGAVPALVEALGDPEAPVRSAAAEALGRIGPEAAEAIPALTALLGQGDEQLEKAIRFALERIEPPGTEHARVLS